MSASVFADHEDVCRAIRIAGTLALLSSVLGALLALVVSRWTARETAPLLALLSLVAVVGGVAVRVPSRLPPAAVVVSLVTGTAFVSAGMVIVGSPAVDGADNEMLFLLPLLYSAYFCRPWVIALVTTTASVGYAVALLAVPSAMPAARWLTTTAALAVVAVLVSVSRARDMRRLATAAEEAGHDPLTGLLNRRGLEARAAVRLADGEPFSLLLVDIDHFKLVNDMHGHAAGDDVLVQVADVLRGGSRAGDLVARVGGEEFVVVLPACEAAEALRRARTLCHRVEQESPNWAAPVTLSIGAATELSTSDLASDLTGLLTAADGALYAAKGGGRNTVRAARSPAAGSPPNPMMPAQDRRADVLGASDAVSEEVTER